MRLSPLDIQHMEFGRTVNGYNRQQVRDFLERIADEHDLMVREIQALRDEMRSQDEKIEDFLASEADLKRAVIAAERIGNEMKENARKEAELIVKEAEQLKEEIVRDAERRLKSAHAELSRLERAQTVFREQFRGMLQGFERSLDNLPAIRAANDPEPERSAKPAEPAKPARATSDSPS